jgi:hypothetical protein
MGLPGSAKLYDRLAAVTQGLRDCRYAPFQVLQAASITLPKYWKFSHILEQSSQCQLMAFKPTSHELSILNRSAARPFRITQSRSARSRDQAAGEWYRRCTVSLYRTFTTPKLACNGNKLRRVVADLSLDKEKLQDALREDSEALFAGAGTAGGRLAAEAALQRVRARVEELARHDPQMEQQFSLPDQWSRHLLLALCRPYGLRPFRYHRQRRNTVMIRTSRGFVDKVLLRSSPNWRGRCNSICTR